MGTWFTHVLFFPCVSSIQCIDRVASIPRNCVFTKHSWFSLDRTSLIFRGFRNSVVSFCLTASEGKRLAVCVASGLILYFPKLAQFLEKVDFSWSERRFRQS